MLAGSRGVAAAAAAGAASRGSAELPKRTHPPHSGRGPAQVSKWCQQRLLVLLQANPPHGYSQGFPAGRGLWRPAVEQWFLLPCAQELFLVSLTTRVFVLLCMARPQVHPCFQ
jgi:hypothetical protein